MTAITDQRHKQELIVRLRRIEGQLRGIQAMIDQGRDCERVTQQLSAARKALDKAFFQVLACAVREPSPKPAGKAERDERLGHVAELLARFG